MSPGFRPHQPGLRKLLGDLEAAIMDVVWAREPQASLTVREVYESLLAHRKVAYTTVMTVMGNLAKKGVLVAEKDGSAYRYHAPLSQDDFTRRAVGNIIDDLLSDFSVAAIAHFAQALESRPEEDALARLKVRLERARREQEG